MKTMLAAAIKQTIHYHMKNIHTSMPGEIVDYDFTTQKASVLPTIKEKFYTGEILSMPIVTNVPVIFPRSANASLTFPLAKGDKVLLLFSEKSLERWLSSGEEVEMGVNRRFDLSDGIVIPGLYSFADQSPSNGEDLILQYKDSKIIIKKDGTIQSESGDARLELKSTGEITIENSGDSLLDILSDTLREISQITIGGTPIDNIAVFNILKTRLDSLK